MILSIDVVLLVVAGYFFAYLAFLSILALINILTQSPNRPASTDRNQQRQFAIVIPAHNEEGVIAHTLHSIFALHYPRQSYEVVVVADNCDDGTADVARRRGATVLVRRDESNCGKGYALRWAFDQLMSRGHHAFVVVDADSTVSHNFLRVMNFYLQGGAEIIQSADLVQPHQKAWSSEITRLGFLLYNVARPLGRSLLKCTAGLRGNGMCFSRDVFRALPWNAFSRAEDLEYSLSLVLQGKSVVFAPEAKVFATMPSDARNAESQRARWETGRFPLIKEYAGKLLVRAIRQRSFVAFDAFTDLVMPPIVNLFAFSLFMLSAHLVGVALGYDAAHWFMYGWLFVVALGAIHILLGLLASGADKDIYRALLYAPRYITWKLILYAKLAIKGQTHAWVRTTRE